MKRRAYLAIALAAPSIIGCAALVGIGDLPIDASAPRDSSTSPEDASMADVGSDDATSVDRVSNEDATEDATDDGSTKDAALRDVAVRDAGARDASTDRVSTDGPTLSGDASSSDGNSSDASDASVDRKPIPDAAADRTTAASCVLRAVDAGATCAMCVQAQCCNELEACEMADEAGVDDAGQSACIRLVNITLVCTVAAGDPSSTCTQANQYTPSQQTNATALVTCLQQSCPVQCNNVIAVPGI